jgi:CRISPR-associated protein Cas1
MKDLFIFNNGRLKRKDNTIQFIDSDENKKIIPIEQVENIHLLGELDLNTQFLNLLTGHGIILHVYNYYGYYSGSYVPRTKQVSGFIDVRQAAHVLDKKKRMYIAQQFLNGGIHHMKKNLRQHKEQTHLYLDTIDAEWSKIDETNSIPELMGIEGNIRQIYYQSFNEIIKNKDFQALR